MYEDYGGLTFKRLPKGFVAVSGAKFTSAGVALIGMDKSLVLPVKTLVPSLMVKY